MSWSKWQVAALILLAAVLAAKGPFWQETPGVRRNDITTVSTDDVNMNTAIAEAQDSLPQFLANVLDPSGKMELQSALKVAMPTITGPSTTEHIWVTPFQSLGDGRFSGTLDDVPNDLGDLKIGETITFSQDQITDWIIVMPDGFLYGGYTLRVLRRGKDGLSNGPLFSKEFVPADW